MMRLLLLFSFCLFLVLPGQAQERVRNVRIYVVDSSQVEIRYDLINARPGDSVYFEIRSRLRGTLQILPEFIRGDIGVEITAGTDRRIRWDALANGYSLSEEVQATILVRASVPLIATQPAKTQPITNPGSTIVAETPSPQQPALQQPSPQPASVIQSVEPAPVAVAVDSVVRSPRTRYAGPAWALLSAVAPGIGNIFVQMPKPKIGLRPLVTIGCYGLIAYGLSERKKAQDEYASYEDQKNMAAGEPYYQTANNHHHRYFMATRGAVLVAAADVILTFIKGLRNSQIQKEAKRFQGASLRPGLQAGQVTAVVRYAF